MYVFEKVLILRYDDTFIYREGIMSRKHTTFFGKPMEDLPKKYKLT